MSKNCPKCGKFMEKYDNYKMMDKSVLNDWWCPDCELSIPLNHASLSEGDLVATECPKCGASLIDMDWDLLKVEGGALLCDGCDYAFTEPPKPLGRGK